MYAEPHSYSLPSNSIHQNQDNGYAPIGAAKLYKATSTSNAKNSLVNEICLYFEKQRINQDRSLYLITITYNEPKNGELTFTLANKNLERLWRRLLQELSGRRHFERSWFRKIEPTMFSFVDVPNSKAKNLKVGSIPVHASTVHHHSIIACHEDHVAKMDTLTDSSVADAWMDLIKEDCHLRSLHVKRIGPTRADIHRVVDYVTIHARRFWNRQEWDEVYRVFPKSSSEYA